MTDATGLCWRLIAGFLGLAVTCRWNMTGATARSALAHDRFSETVSNLLLSGTWLVLQRGLCWIIAGLLRLAVSCRWNMTTLCYRSVVTHCRFAEIVSKLSLEYDCVVLQVCDDSLQVCSYWQ